MKKGIVSKLKYRARGTFTITAELGHNSFEIKQYDDTASTPHKYTREELYLLLLTLLPLTPLDISDQ